jgi:hypothetical protein
VLNEALGTQFQTVAGYKQATAIDLAVQRGEVNGRAGESWYGQKGTTWDWLRAGKAKIILQIGFRKADDLQNVPLLLDLVQNDPKKRQLVELFSSPAKFGKPTVVAPGVPAARVAALRQAYAETMTDPEFLADAGKLGVDIQPVSDGQDFPRREPPQCARAQKSPRVRFEGADFRVGGAQHQRKTVCEFEGLQLRQRWVVRQHTGRNAAVAEKCEQIRPSIRAAATIVILLAIWVRQIAVVDLPRIAALLQHAG